MLYLLFFFFKQKTAYEMRISDWSSDVCSSDLGGAISRIMASQAPFTAPATASAPAASRARPGALPSWLFAVAALVFLMVVIGGITRLTESGLSMVRWEPVSGAIPPLDAEAWQAEFDAYRQSPQYIEINRGMSLAEFKEIYFWEYVHRLLGRVIGLAFALPLLWFWARRAIPAGYGWRLVGLLALGRSEEHTSELQSLMRISYAVFCSKKKKTINTHNQTTKTNI